jgi:hypothetical protein
MLFWVDRQAGKTACQLQGEPWSRSTSYDEGKGMQARDKH